jgi:hypothetical protein
MPAIGEVALDESPKDIPKAKTESPPPALLENEDTL